MLEDMWNSCLNLLSFSLVKFFFIGCCMKNRISFYEISQPKNSPEADPCSQKNDSRASAFRAPQTLHQEEG